MTNSDVTQSNPVAEWATLYAKSYGELCSLIESFKDDTIAREDLFELYRHHTDYHYELVCKLGEKAARDQLTRMRAARNDG